MKDRLGRFLNLRQGESLYVGYMLLHYFFQGVGISILFIVANTLFLSRFDVEQLPLVFMCSALVLLLLGKANDYIGHRFPVQKVLLGIAVMVAATVFLFFIGTLEIKALWLPFALYIGYQVVALQIDTEFWSLSSFLFDVRQAKRLYGLISVGDVPAKLVGSLSVALLADALGGVSNLLLVSTASFVLGSVVIWQLMSKIKPHHFAHHHANTHQAQTSGTGVLSRFFRSDLVMALSALYLAGAIAVTFVEFSFLSGVEHKFRSQKELADFFAVVFAVGNGIIVLGKLFFSARVIERLGVRRSLLVWPVFLGLACTAMMVLGKMYPDQNAILWYFTVMVVFSDVFKNVLYDPLFLALFQPLPVETRHRAHNIISGLVNPIGLGASGLFLYIGILAWHHINLNMVTYTLIGLIVAWAALVVHTARKYKETLKAAIDRRMIEGGWLDLADEGTVKVLKEKLQSQRPDEVIYACEILMKTHPQLFVAETVRLLAHPVWEVRLYVLNSVLELKAKPDNDQLYGLACSDPVPQVREAAVKLYCTIYEDLVDRISPMFDSPDPLVRAAAIKGFLKSGDLEPMMIGGQQLLKTLESKKEEEIIVAIGIVGDMGFKNYYRPLLDFLAHPSEAVQKAAIAACGKIKNPKLIEYLFPLMENGSLRKAVMETFAEMGEPMLAEIGKPAFAAKYPLEAIRLCSRIGTQKGTEILFAFYFETATSETLDELLKALAKAKAVPATYQDQIKNKLQSELGFGFKCIQLAAAVEAGQAGFPKLLGALLHEISNSKSRLFLLLGFLYDRQAIEKAAIAYRSVDKEKAANALELLENTIDRDLKTKMFPILEEIPLAHKLALLETVLGPRRAISASEVPQMVLSDGQFLQWTQAVALYECGHVIEDSWLDPKLFFQSKLLSECARHAQDAKQLPINKSSIPKNMDNKANLGYRADRAMLEIEKILVLKSTNMFAATPENILVGIAGISKEEHRRKGENIFVKDSLGNCLYIICEGDISIHIDGKELTQLHGRDIFGELALLDPEPRSATATALNDCLLLRIDQAEFSELVDDRPEVAQGMLTILSRRIRSQNAVINGMQTGNDRPSLRA